MRTNKIKSVSISWYSWNPDKCFIEITRKHRGGKTSRAYWVARNSIVVDVISDYCNGVIRGWKVVHGLGVYPVITIEKRK